MKPIKFKEQNMIVAKDQPEYLSLPALRIPKDAEGKVMFCVGLTFKERVKILFSGKLWCILVQFRDRNNRPNPVTPSYFSVSKKDVLDKMYDGQTR